MISLPQSLPCCPQCQEPWRVRDKSLYYGWETYLCIKDNFIYLLPDHHLNNKYIYLQKRFGNKIIWWGSQIACKIGTEGEYLKNVEAIIPFNITEEQLKLYLIMS
jgi:hypothetical protein